MLQPNRRDVLKAALAEAAAQPLRGSGRRLRIGFAGLGARASALLEVALGFDAVEVPAVWDSDRHNAARAQALVEGRGRKRPETYAGAESDIRRLCGRDDVDLVFNAAPLEHRAAVCVAAMQAGKHVASEGPAAATLDECWELVETSMKTGRYCSLLETECYSRQALTLLNMFRGGLLGEPLFAESMHCEETRANSSARIGNLSPSHAFGPIAWWMNINRGDRCVQVVSTTSKASAGRRFINTTLIGTDRGRTISLYFDSGMERPAEKLLRVQGSKGAYSGLLNKIFVDGRSMARKSGLGDDPEWESLEPYAKVFEHRLWTGMDLNATADLILLMRLIETIGQGRPPDIDVFDTAAWSAIVPVSEASVTARRAVELPDFTRGGWKTRTPVDPASRA